MTRVLDQATLQIRSGTATSPHIFRFSRCASYLHCLRLSPFKEPVTGTMLFCFKIVLRAMVVISLLCSARDSHLLFFMRGIHVPYVQRSGSVSFMLPKTDVYLLHFERRSLPWHHLLLWISLVLEVLIPSSRCLSPWGPNFLLEEFAHRLTVSSDLPHAFRCWLEEVTLCVSLR